jgi:cell wall-associated NlpC family hydrolase
MLDGKIAAVKYSLLGYAMLVLAGCSTTPSNVADLTPLQTTQPDPNRNAQASQASLKSHTTSIKRTPSALDDPKSKLTNVAMCAIGQRGKLYCWGGTSPRTGFDCSGLTQYSFRQGAGVSIPRTAAAQYASAVKIPQDQARKGDLVFFRTRGSQISHVGIYLGDNKFIHAPRTGKSIATSTLSGYWQHRLAGFGRIPGACRPMYS